MPVIGVRVDDETKRLWDILNKHPDRIGIKELKKAIKQIIEKHRDWIEIYIRMTTAAAQQNEIGDLLKDVESISDEEILSEITT